MFWFCLVVLLLKQIGSAKVSTFFTEEITSLNPWTCQDPYCASLLNLSTHRLTRVEKGVWSLSVAKDYVREPQGSWFYHRFFFHSQDPFKPEAFLKSFESILDPQTASHCAFYFDLNGVKKIFLQDEALVILTSHEAPFLPYYLSLPCFGLFENKRILSQNLFKNQFVLKNRQKEGLSFQLKGVLSSNNLLDSYLSGEADFLLIRDSIQLERALKAHFSPEDATFGWLYLTLNQRKGSFFQNKETRQALMQTFTPSVTKRLFPSRFRFSFPLLPQVFHKEQGKDLLPPEKPLKFLLRSDGILYEIGMQLAHIIQTRLGWPLELLTKPFPQDLHSATLGDFDLTLTVYRPDFPLPLEFFLLLNRSSHFNHGAFQNSLYDDILNDYLRNPAPAFFSQLQNLVKDEIPLIPLGDLPFYLIQSPHHSSYEVRLSSAGSLFSFGKRKKEK